jgi:hypothetical protein
LFFIPTLYLIFEEKFKRELKSEEVMQKEMEAV